MAQFLQGFFISVILIKSMVIGDPLIHELKEVFIQMVSFPMPHLQYSKSKGQNSNFNHHVYCMYRFWCMTSLH